LGAHDSTNLAHSLVADTGVPLLLAMAVRTVFAQPSAGEDRTVSA
jgi:hypothetical protein